MVGKKYSKWIFPVIGLLILGCKTDEEKLQEYRLNEERCCDYSFVDSISNNPDGKYSVKLINDEFIEDGDEVLLILGEKRLRIYDHSARFNLDPNKVNRFVPRLYLKRKNHYYRKSEGKALITMDPKYKCFRIDVASQDLYLYVGCN